MAEPDELGDEPEEFADERDESRTGDEALPPDERGPHRDGPGSDGEDPVVDPDQEPDEDSDDEDDEDDEDFDDDDEEGHPEPEVTVEVSSLSLYTHFGVTAAEREIGQRLIVDLRLDIGACDATVTDRVQDTVDYGEVCQLVYLISQQREYRTLERFCAVVADRLIERYDLHSVWVKASKPEPPIPLPLGEVSVEVWRET